MSLRARKSLFAVATALGAQIALCAVIDASAAEAQSVYSDAYNRRSESPENFAFELRIGAYSPDVGNDAFDRVFDDLGPMVALELDYYPFRIPFVGLVGAGLQMGWARYTGPGCVDAECTPPDDESTVNQELKFRIFPITPMAALRVDVLARKLDVPLVFVGKVGLDAIFYTIDNGSEREASGSRFGLRWAAQAALELDFIAPHRARALDDEWGINHSYLFFELYGSTASFVGTHLAWTAGLALTF